MNKKIGVISILVLVVFLILFAEYRVNSEETISKTVDKKNEYFIENYIKVNQYLKNRTDEIKWVYENLIEYYENKEAELRPEILDLPLDDALLDYIWKKSLDYDIAYTLILAIMSVESDFGRITKNVNLNGTVDSGIMQINSRNTKWLADLAGIEKVDVHNDYHSIDMAIELIKYERDYFRSLGLSEEDVFYYTVLSYNRGRNGAVSYVKRYGMNHNAYVKKVLSEKERLENKII